MWSLWDSTLVFWFLRRGYLGFPGFYVIREWKCLTLVTVINFVATETTVETQVVILVSFLFFTHQLTIVVKLGLEVLFKGRVGVFKGGWGEFADEAIDRF